MMENWKDIPGYEGLYQVSDMGRVKSCARVVPSLQWGTQKVSERILKQSLDKGYLRVTLSFNNKQFRKAVHYFVALVFVPNPDNKPNVNHIDGIKINNYATNVEWCTASENEIHSYEVLGKVNPIRKLELSDVEYIRSVAKKAERGLHRGNMKYVASLFNVNVTTIHNILNNRYYV